MIQAVTRLTRPQTLLVVVVSSAARHILHAVQVPYENFLAVSLFESSPLGSHSVEVVLIEGDANQRVIYLGNDVVSVLETVDGHGRCTAELDGQLDAVRLNLLYHLLENSNSVLADLVNGSRNGQVHGRYDNDHLAAHLVAVNDDLIQLCHNGVLLLLGLLHVEEDQGVVGQHLQVMLRVSEPGSQIVDGVLAGSDLAVEALGLDVDVVKAVLLAQVEVFEYGVVFAETVAAFVKANLHDKCLLNLILLQGRR